MRVHLLGGPRDGDTIEVLGGSPGTSVLVAPKWVPTADRDPDEVLPILRYQATDEFRRVGIFEAPARVYAFEGFHR